MKYSLLYHVCLVLRLQAIVHAKMLEEQGLSRNAKAALKEHSLSLSRLVSSRMRTQ